jgi:hypothetical protein
MLEDGSTPCPGWAWTTAAGELRDTCLMHDNGEAALERKRAGGGVRRVATGQGAPRDAKDALEIAAELVGALAGKGGRPRDLIDSLMAYAKLLELSEFEKRLQRLEGVDETDD